MSKTQQFALAEKILAGERNQKYVVVERDILEHLMKMVSKVPASNSGLVVVPSTATETMILAAAFDADGGPISRRTAIHVWHQMVRARAAHLK